MKNLVPMITAGALVSLALYGVLNAVAHPHVEPEDPWRDAWLAAGLKAQFVSVSSDPSADLMFGDGRDLMKGREFDGTVLRRYVVQGVSVQVITLPHPELLPQFSAGNTFAFRLRPNGSVAHVSRYQRHLLLIKTHTSWTPFIGEVSTPEVLTKRIWSAFSSAAQAHDP